MNRPPDCPFCRSNNLLDAEVIAETPAAFMVPARGAPGSYLIIPSDHIVAVADLPSGWWREVQTLLPQAVSGVPSYNVSLNIGADAGQTVDHLHFWVIPRAAGDAVAGKGLARLLSEANQE